MNNNSYGQVEKQINLKEVIWDLLEQWKAILIVAILMSIIVCGLKYAKDMNAYNKGEEQKAVDKKSGLTVEQRIEEIVSALPEDEQSTVEYLIKQEDWIQAEKEYVSNSILMNLNPANQRTLTLDYYIAANDNSNSNIESLVSGYDGYTRDEKFIESLGKAIDPEAESRYIAELINSDKESSMAGQLESGVDEAATIFTVSIALPEETDITAVETAVTTSFKEHSPDLSKRISPHSITLINAAEGYKHNATVVQNRNNLLNSIYYLTNNAKNIQAYLSDEQKQALESVKAIKSEKDGEDKETAADSTAAKPGFSKKYALLGFVLGMMVYALVYLLLIITRGRVNYAGDSELYTQARLLGEIYEKADHKSLGTLLHSGIVDKYRYGNKMDSDVQQAKIFDALSAVCKHADVSEATVYNMANSVGTSTIDSIIEKAKKQGVKLTQTKVAGDIDEKSLPSVENALFVLSPEAKVSDLVNLVELCRTYDINMLGTVFIGNI